MGKPDQPDAPDPFETAKAQTGASIATMLANTAAGQVNQVTPYGSLNYDRTGSTRFKDPNTGDVYKIPNYTATTSLTPLGQDLFDANAGAQLNLANLAKDQSEFLGEYMATPFSFEGLPEAGSVSNFTADASAIGDGMEARDRAEEALMARLNPYLERDRQAMQTQLANQGITLGSEAYQASQDDFARGANDARLAAILAAGEEAQRTQGMDIARYGATRQSDLDLFGAANTERTLALQEALTERNQPLNEIAALLGGSQVAVPNFNVAGGATMPTTDVAGLINGAFNQELAAYQQQSGNRNSLMGGLFGLGASALLGFGG